MSTRIIYKELSYKIVGILFEVYNELGYGYKESHYQKALELSFSKSGLRYRSQCPYSILFRNEIIGRYYMDFIIEEKVVLEIKRN
jgi:GxxExxY protein